jgi:hypothetical protein
LYEKTDAGLEASMRLDVQKWMASLKKAPSPKKSAKELEAEGKMLRCLAEPKKPMLSNYKRTMQNPHCIKRSCEILENDDKQMLKFYEETGLSLEQLHDQSKIQMAYAPKADEILENEDEQMLKFCQESGLSLEQLHGQSKIQMAYAPKAWVVGELMVDEKCFDNSTQTRIFHQWYLQQIKRGRLMFEIQYRHQHFYHGDGKKWIMWDEMYSLIKGGELGAQIICLWEL